MSYFCIACQKEVDGCRHVISCDCVSDGNIGFVGQVHNVFIYLMCHYFPITDFTLSSLYFPFQFLNE